MTKSSKYRVFFEFKIDNLQLFISKDKSWGINLKYLTKNFSDKISYLNDLGDTIEFKIDWDKSQIKKYYEDYHIVDTIEGHCFIYFPNELGENYDHWKFDAYFRCFLHLLFFICNIHLPGSLDLHRCKYRAISDMFIQKYEDQDSIFTLDQRFNLKGEYQYITDDMFHYLWQQQIFILKKISLTKIIQWTLGKKIWFNQISHQKNRIEGAILGLIHLFFNDKLSNNELDQVVYLSKIIESLFDSPRTIIVPSLLNRIQLVVNLNLKEFKGFKKIFEDFYNLRSKIVHGDFMVNNPVLFDNFADDPNGMIKIWQETDVEKLSIIYALIFITFGKMIDSNLNKLEFKEILIKK